MDMNLQKPPIGIMPRWLWLEFLEGENPSEVEIQNRKREIQLAILRYLNSPFKPLQEWYIELSSYCV